MGPKKRRSKGFDVGHSYYIPYSKKIKNNDGIEVPVLHVPRKSARLAKKMYDNPNTDSSEYFIASKNKIETLMNQGFNDHKKEKPKCLGGSLLLERTNHVIISTEWQLVCSKCDFKSAKCKMYDEYKRHKGETEKSTLNDALGFALLKSAIGPTGFHELCLFLGIDPGSKSHLQDLISDCGNMMLVLGEEIIHETRQKLLQQYGSAWILSNDTTYNNRLISNSSPFAGGTMAVSTTVEEMSGQRLVVDLVTASKLPAPVYRSGPNKGNVIDLQTIYLKPQDDIANEGLYAQKTAESLKNSNITIQTLGADSDSRVRGGVKNVFPDFLPQQDTQHFNKSFKNKLKATEFSNQMFMKKNKKKQITKLRKIKKQGYLAQDIAARCYSEFNRVHKKCKKIKNKDKLKATLKQKLSHLPETIADCYQGNHKRCKKYSYVCQPPLRLSVKKYYPKKLNMTRDDRTRLINLLNWRFGDASIEKLFMNINTQKVEALHRKYLKVNPKSITCRRNFRARILSSVVDTNLGLSGSVARVHMRISHQICRKVKLRLEMHENHILNQRAYHKSCMAKNRRVNKISNLIVLHNQKRKEKKNSSIVNYQKELDVNMDQDFEG